MYYIPEGTPLPPYSGAAPCCMDPNSGPNAIANAAGGMGSCPLPPRPHVGRGVRAKGATSISTAPPPQYPHPPPQPPHHRQHQQHPQPRQHQEFLVVPAPVQPSQPHPQPQPQSPHPGYAYQCVPVSHIPSVVPANYVLAPVNFSQSAAQPQLMTVLPAHSGPDFFQPVSVHSQVPQYYFAASAHAQPQMVDTAITAAVPATTKAASAQTATVVTQAATPVVSSNPTAPNYASSCLPCGSGDLAASLCSNSHANMSSIMVSPPPVPPAAAMLMTPQGPMCMSVNGSVSGGVFQDRGSPPRVGGVTTTPIFTPNSTVTIGSTDNRANGALYVEGRLYEGRVRRFTNVGEEQFASETSTTSGGFFGFLHATCELLPWPSTCEGVEGGVAPASQSHDPSQQHPRQRGAEKGEEMVTVDGVRYARRPVDIGDIFVHSNALLIESVPDEVQQAAGRRGPPPSTVWTPISVATDRAKAEFITKFKAGAPVVFRCIVPKPGERKAAWDVKLLPPRGVVVVTPTEQRHRQLAEETAVAGVRRREAAAQRVLESDQRGRCEQVECMARRLLSMKETEGRARALLMTEERVSRCGLEVEATRGFSASPALVRATDTPPMPATASSALPSSTAATSTIVTSTSPLLSSRDPNSRRLASNFTVTTTATTATERTELLGAATVSRGSRSRSRSSSTSHGSAGAAAGAGAAGGNEDAVEGGAQPRSTGNHDHHSPKPSLTPYSHDHRHEQGMAPHSSDHAALESLSAWHACCAAIAPATASDSFPLPDAQPYGSFNLSECGFTFHCDGRGRAGEAPATGVEVMKRIAATVAGAVGSNNLVEREVTRKATVTPDSPGRSSLASEFACEARGRAETKRDALVGAEQFPDCDDDVCSTEEDPTLDVEIRLALAKAIITPTTNAAIMPKFTTAATTATIGTATVSGTSAKGTLPSLPTGATAVTATLSDEKSVPEHLQYASCDSFSSSSSRSIPGGALYWPRNGGALACPHQPANGCTLVACGIRRGGDGPSMPLAGANPLLTPTTTPRRVHGTPAAMMGTPTSLTTTGTFLTGLMGGSTSTVDRGLMSEETLHKSGLSLTDPLSACTIIREESSEPSFFL